MRSKPMSPVSFIPMVKPDIRPLALTYKTKNQYIQKTIIQATKIPSWHKRQRYMIYVHSRLFYLQCCHWFPAEKKWNVSWHLLKVGNNGRTRRPSHSNVWPHNGFFPLMTSAARWSFRESWTPGAEKFSKILWNISLPTTILIITFKF